MDISVLDRSDYFGGGDIRGLLLRKQPACRLHCGEFLLFINDIYLRREVESLPVGTIRLEGWR